MKRAALYLFAIIFLIGCSSTNPELQKKVDNYFSKNSTEVYVQSGNFSKPMPYEIGQWVLYGIENEEGRQVYKTAVIGREADKWIIESYKLNASAETAIQICFRGLLQFRETGKVSEAKVAWIRVRDEEGAVRKYKKAELEPFRSMIDKSFNMFAVNVNRPSSGGDLQVQAGKFKNTTKVSSQISYLGNLQESDAWCSYEVPITGLVKSESNLGKAKMTLLDFGRTGARSVF